MKKLVAFVASAVLAGSVFAFAGCKDKDEDKGSNTIPGNYQEATKEEVGEALGKVEFDKVLPDLSQEGAKLGFELSSNLTVNANVPISVTIQGQTGTGSITMSAVEDVKYNLVLADQLSSYTGAGHANGTINIGGSLQGETYSTGYVAKLGLYNDTDYCYVNINDLKSPNEESESGGMVTSPYVGGKVKLSMQEIIEIVMDYIPDLGGSDEVAPTAAEATPDEGATGNIGFAEYLDMLAELDIKVALDQKSGLKVKVSVDKNSLTKILAYVKAMAEAEEDAEVAGYIDMFTESVTVNKFNVDLYVALTEAGAFDKAAVDMDIDLKVKGETLTGALGNINPQLAAMGIVCGDSTLTVKGGLSVSTYNGTVTLPEGIATDTNYQLIPLGGNADHEQSNPMA